MAQTPTAPDEAARHAQQGLPGEQPDAQGNAPQQEQKRGSAADYLSNERTLLAWIRTGIALIALGFVVARFSLLLRQLGLQGHGSGLELLGGHWAAIIGTGIVALAAVLLALSYLRYRVAARALDRGAYHDSRGLAIGVVAVVILVAVTLAVYLLITS